MAVEIERKFLVVSDGWRQHVSHSQAFRQGYLSNSKHASVRVRVADGQATLNIKGMTIGVQRPEYEYAVPLDDATELLDTLCGRPLIEKTRHFVTFAGKLWEIDEFHGDNAGLVVAEVELDAVDEAFGLPAWAGLEVSDQPRYYNVCLTRYPYSQWTALEQQPNLCP